MKRLLLFIISLIGFSVLSAQNQYSFTNISLKEGLSNSLALDMAIDRQGFVWVTTESGLNRISGNTRTIYKKENSDIASNDVTAIYADTLNNQVWVATKQDGISIFDGETQHFKSFSLAEGLLTDAVSCMVTAADGGIWILHWGGQIQHYDGKTGQLTELNIGQKMKSQTCLDDGKGHLYIGHLNDGLSIVDIRTKKVKRFTSVSDDPQSLPGNHVRSIFIDHYKTVWIGTSQGLALFNPQLGKFRRFQHSPSDSYSIASNNIYSITEMNGDRLCIASDQGGVSLLDLKSVAFSEKEQPRFDNNYFNRGLSSRNSRKVLEDAYGNIWVAQYQTGVDVITPDRRKFQIIPLSHHIFSMSYYANGYDWKNVHLPFGTIQCMEEDSEGCVWLGFWDAGVYRYNPSRQEFLQIDLGQNTLDVWDLYLGSESKMWIGSELGIFSYSNGIIDREELIAQVIGHPVVMALTEDTKGQLWIGTMGHGLFCLSKDKQHVTRYTKKEGMPSNHINDILIDSDQTIWVATRYGLVNISTQGIQIYNQDQGLDDTHVRAIQEDRSGNIWVSTYSGIACLDTGTLLFHNYSHEDGIPFGNFIEKSAATSSDGTIYFGNSDGVCFFNPQAISISQNQTDVRILCCEILRSQTERLRVGSSGGMGLQNYMLSPDKKGIYHISHSENTFRISFATPDFSQKDVTDYSYMMKGAEDKWYDTEGDDQVTFLNLAPGIYTFILRAKQKNQTWDHAVQEEIVIVVHPPFWLTWWAKLLYILIGAGVIYWNIRAYKHKLELKNSLFLSQRENIQKEELNEERLRFFTNVAHELRTPLTLILGPLEDLVGDKRMPEAYHKKVALIQTSAVRLRDLINDILEFRKTETQNRQLTVAKGNVGALVKEVGEGFKSLNSNPDVAVHIMVNPAIPPVYYDSEVFTTILNNLLSNAFKYTRSGAINVILNTDGDRLNMTVSDTGYGIDSEALPHIFDRYYQAKGSHQASGTGIGLALVKSLADLHQGTMTVKSELGKGTEFTFSVSVNNTYPNALHKEDKEEEEVTSDELKAISEVTDETDERPLLLVVEDNNDIRQYIKESFSDDYRILQARDGQEGLSLAYGEIPDIIVSDIMMPQMDGIEMTRHLKDDVRTSHIPVILLTAKSTNDDRELGYDSGADSYLTKPFSARLLRSRIQNLLSSRRHLAELIQLRLQQSQDDADTEMPIEDSSPVLSDLDQKFIEKLNRLIEENISDEDLDMNEMASKLAMSYSTFYRKMKTLMGMSPNDYIRKTRLHRCMELLKSGNYNVTEAAMMTGFNNPGNFRERFKKEFGKSPSAFIPQNK